MPAAGFSNTQCHIVVSVENVDHVLSEGYKCRQRKEVPCSFEADPYHVIQKLQAARPDLENGWRDVVVLPVRRRMRHECF